LRLSERPLALAGLARGEGKAMGFDLKRVYFSVTAFVVLLVAFFAAIGVFASASAWVVLSTTPFEQRYPSGYALQAPAAAAQGQAERPAPPADVAPAQPVPAKPVAMDDYELNNAREGLANSLATLLLALPIWYFHWERYRRLAQARQAFLMYRVYGYAFMVIALVTVIISGGNIFTQIFRAVLGVLDLTTRYAQLTLIHQMVGSLLSVGWALLWWRYHWRAVEALPEPAAA
jgi:hypothetical protein